MLGLRGREREPRKLAALAEVSERLIGIDGTPQTFRYIEAGRRWAAVRRTDRLTITITGHAVEVDQLKLALVDDPPRDLLGPNTR